jgi:phage shock protein PspC (stress-responsive transcriptional regulator)
MFDLIAERKKKIRNCTFRAFSVIYLHTQIQIKINMISPFDIDMQFFQNEYVRAFTTDDAVLYSSIAMFAAPILFRPVSIKYSDYIMPTWIAKLIVAGVLGLFGACTAYLAIAIYLPQEFRIFYPLFAAYVIMRVIMDRDGTDTHEE